MDIARAFSYIFEDQEWVNKLTIIAILTFAVALFPLGFIALAALLGYALELAINVRAGSPAPLPRWDNYVDRMGAGFNVMIAYFVYNIPNLLIGGCIFTLSGSFRSGFLGGGIAIVFLCCGLPLLLIFNLIIAPMLAVGMLRYAETGQSVEFYRFSTLFAVVRAHAGPSFQWLVLSWFASFVMSFLVVIPCLGWIALLALILPVQGHLLGQFALLLDEKPKKPKRAEPYPR